MSALSSYVAFLIFAVLLAGKVEFWSTRIVLAGMVAGVYFLQSPLFAMILAVVLSIGILIRSQLPTVSGM